MQKINYKTISIVERFNAGEKEKALKEIEFLINSNEKNIDLLFIYTKMLINVNQINKAISILSKILLLEPKNKLAIEMIYSNLIKVKKLEKAEKYIDKLLKLKDIQYEVLRDKAYLRYLKNDIKESERFINKALTLNPNEVFGLNILGLLKMQNKKINESIKIFEKAISIDKNYTDSYNNIGKCYIDLENLNAAYLYFKKAYRINKKIDLPIINIANILSLKDKNKFAIKFLLKAKSLNTENIIIDENIAMCKCRLKDFKWVQNYYNSTKNQNHQNYDFILGYSYLLLSKYKFAEGFKLFDSRLLSNKFPEKNIYHKNILDKLIKEDEINPNNEILIIKEQGVGDEILFSSMYYDLINHCKNLSIECDERLIKIFKRTYKNNIFFKYGYFSSTKKNIKKFDKIIYAGSLTKYFRNNKSDFISKKFLKSNVDIDNNIGEKLNKFNKTKKIGLSWKSVVNIYGGLKSLNLRDFEKIFNNDRTIINLQYGDVNKEINDLNNYGYKIYNFKDIDLFNDFDSVISILKNLDIFVTVSNSTAHFAGALGVPTILICPRKSSTYYYWDYEDGKTPWYKSVSVIKLESSINRTIDLVNKMIDKI